MPNHLSVLGIIHTAISIIALIAGFTAVYKTGKIDPKNSMGKWYILLTVITCLTALPIMKTGHPTGGHYLGIMILVLLPLGIYARRIFGRAAGFAQLFIMSTTLFLSMIPAIIETLTRLPLSHPLAAGPNDPIILKALSGLILIYLVGVSYQEVKYRRQQKAARSGALAPEQTK
ncbi:MAG TPA: hypothetical protein VG367_14570 [Mucilaginibacter sp.]|jgi:hypothetical protein|nr:hypothetical protein [Mucilaginibacter sp.]